MKLVVPKIKISPVGELYELQEDATYEFGSKSIIVPAGFTYDGASIPFVFWQEIGTPFDPRFMAGALPHDRLYTTHEQDKDFADRMLKAVLLHSGVGHIKAELIYLAVRDFGGGHWGSRTEG